MSRSEMTVAQMKAVEENLGDLKLYRVPERVTVSAKGLKQIAFLDKDSVKGKLVYESDCSWWRASEDAMPARMRFETVNDAKHGLGAAMPMGGITFFEPGPAGDLFVGEEQLRDYAEGQEVEIELGGSAQVFATCERVGGIGPDEGWARMKATLTNANPGPVRLRLRLGSPLEWRMRGLRKTRVKDAETVYEETVPANATLDVSWELGNTGA